MHLFRIKKDMERPSNLDYRKESFGISDDTNVSDILAFILVFFYAR